MKKSYNVKKPRFIYFDLDDTILDHRSAEKKSLADLQHQFPEQLGDVDTMHLQDVYHAQNSVLWKKYSDGEIKKEELRVSRFSQLLEALSIDSLAPLTVSQAYLERYAHHWDYCEGAHEGFFKIAEEYPVGALTNGFAEIQHAKLNRFPELKDAFITCIISEEVGYMKPHPLLFKHAEESAGFKPDEILYVGDSMHSDVIGGHNAGWDVIWFAPEAPDVPEHVVHASSWEEIVDRIVVL